MNELQEFFKQAAEEKRLAVEKKKVEEEWNRKLNPPIDFSSNNLSTFFGAVNTFKKEHVLVAREIKEEETKQESKVNALQVFFDKLNGFEQSLSEQIEKQKDEKTESEKSQEQLEPIIEEPKPEKDDWKDEVKYDVKPSLTETIAKTIEEPKVEQVQLEQSSYFKQNVPKVQTETVDITNLVSAISSITKPRANEPLNKLSDLERLQLEFRHFKDIVTRQMASIGGGGEVRLLNLDDVDTSSLGNGKFLAYNSTTRKLEFTDQVDGN
tara:strand:+ start:1068 stop:1868 length:801 start_codon:yes stop_codon:yes gene_type:complete